MLIYLEIKKEIYQTIGSIKYNNMSWETNVITQISFNKETYNSIYKVEEEIDFCNKRIQEIVNKLMIYSTSRPQDILLNRGEATLETIQEEVEEIEGLSKQVVWAVRPILKENNLGGTFGNKIKSLLVI